MKPRMKVADSASKDLYMKTILQEDLGQSNQ